MSGIADSIFGSGNSTQDVQYGTGPQSADERSLTKLNTELAQKQLDNLNSLAPYQQQLVQSSLAQLKQQSDYTSAYNKLISPEQQAQDAADQVKQAKEMGATQKQLLQMQLDQLKQGGAATDEQKKLIAEATQSSIDAGTEDINTQTKRGIGLISDELANSRGLRLSDAPIGSEAALLTRAGNDQISSLTKNLRASQAQSVLNYPLAVQGLQSGINLSTQSITQAAQQFQDQLRQQAAANRQSLYGTTSSSGIGLSSIGSGTGAATLGTLYGNTNLQGWKGTTGFDPAANNQGYGSFMTGLANIGKSGQAF